MGQAIARRDENRERQADLKGTAPAARRRRRGRRGLCRLLAPDRGEHVHGTVTFGTGGRRALPRRACRSEEHTSELQSLMRLPYAVFCLQKKNMNTYSRHIN